MEKIISELFQKILKEDKLIYVDQEKGKRFGYFGKELEAFALKDKEILKKISPQNIDKPKRIGRHL